VKCWPADWLVPDWPAPARVRACVTTRSGGISQPPFDSFNLGDHVDDAPEVVAENRGRLRQILDVQPGWMSQVHSVEVVQADPSRLQVADANWSDKPGIACAVLTADWLPVLFFVGGCQYSTRQTAPTGERRPATQAGKVAEQ